jgi:hypothetical protein
MLKQEGMMDKKPSMKDKKQDILDAYEELLKKFKERGMTAKPAGKDADSKKAAEDAVVKKASSYSVENVVKGLADLKLDLNKTLTDLSNMILEEANKLREVQQAIAIEEKSLEEIYDIQVAAETLEMLIRTHEEKKKSLEEEITASREQWAKEQERHEIAVKDRDADLKKEREREEKEHAYNLALSRRKDKDAYEEEKAALKKVLKEEKEVQERNLAERGSALAAQEAEISELRAKVAAFPAELSKAIEKAEKEAIASAEKQAKQKAELLGKDVEGERKVAELRIKALEDACAKQAAEIDKLTKQLGRATSQVENIAVKVIESGSGVKASNAANKTAFEQTKSGGE